MRFMLYSKISSQQLWILQRTFASQNRLWICAKSPHAVWIAVATTDVDMLNPVGFSEKMKTTMGMPIYQIGASHAQLVLHRAKDKGPSC